jgi:hypothetical protein
MDEFEDIKKMDPEQRARKLKDIIEKKNKDIETAEKLAKEAEKETEEIIELRKKIDVPEMEDIDISDLFDAEEESLEKAVKKESPPEENETGSLYRISPELATSQIYSDVMGIYNSINQAGRVTAEMAEQAGAIQYAMNQKQEAIQQGEYNPSADIEKQANAIKNISDKILSLYTAGVAKKDMRTI